MTSERVSLAFQQIFPTSVTKTRKFLATQAPALWSRRSVAPCDIWLALLVSSTRAIIDDHMTVITAFGTSWFISNIPLHSSIIYHRDILKTGQAVNSDLHNTVASMCVCVSVRYVVVGAWCELSFKLNCFATRGIFLWVVCVCLYFFPFLYLSTGFFVCSRFQWTKGVWFNRWCVIDIDLYDCTTTQRTPPSICLSASILIAECDRFVFNSFAPCVHIAADT